MHGHRKNGTGHEVITLGPGDITFYSWSFLVTADFRREFLIGSSSQNFVVCERLQPKAFEENPSITRRSPCVKIAYHYKNFADASDYGKEAIT